MSAFFVIQFHWLHDRLFDLSKVIFLLFIYSGIFLPSIILLPFNNIFKLPFKSLDIISIGSNSSFFYFLEAFLMPGVFESLHLTNGSPDSYNLQLVLYSFTKYNLLYPALLKIFLIPVPFVGGSDDQLKIIIEKKKISLITDF